jgi:hypothetical protein
MRRRRYRAGRVDRLFKRYQVELSRACARVGRAVEDTVAGVLDCGRGVSQALTTAAVSTGTLDDRVLVIPHPLVIPRAIEALVLDGRVREAARVAAGLIPVRPSELAVGGSIYLVRTRPDEDLFARPFPAESRVELGPL